MNRDDLTIVVGIELEMEYNAGLLGWVDPASYHSGDFDSDSFGEKFLVEEDGSLRTTDVFSDSSTMELISVPFDSKDYVEVLEDFKRAVYWKVANNKNIGYKEALKQYPNLSDLICFNNSTGAHIHMTFLKKCDEGSGYDIDYGGRDFSFAGKRMRIRESIAMGFVKRFREELLVRMKRAFDGTPATRAAKYGLWKKSLDRDFAKFIVGDEDLMARERRREWNLSSDTGLEYRSFTLRHVKTWDEFFSAWKIVLGALKDSFIEEMNCKKPFLTETKQEFEADDKIEKKSYRRFVLYGLGGNNLDNIGETSVVSISVPNRNTEQVVVIKTKKADEVFESVCN